MLQNVVKDHAIKLITRPFLPSSQPQKIVLGNWSGE